jgi:hypothetical protein
MKGNKPMKTLFLTSVATLALVYSTTTMAQEATMATKLNYADYKEKWRKLESKRIKMTDDVAYSAKKYYGVANYYKTLLKASEGDVKAFGQFSSLDMDGVAGEGNEWNTWVLLHVAGDDTFAKLLAGQSPKVREGYAAFFSRFSTPPISNPKPYIKLHFPKTYAILYGGTQIR